MKPMVSWDDVLMGAVAATTLGASKKGRDGYVRLTGYDPVPLRMAQSPALDAWLVWSNHVTENLPLQFLAEKLGSALYLTDGASAYGAANVRRGLSSPASGALANPLAESSDAFLRAAFWGLAFHGDPVKAADYAFHDASIDHAGHAVSVSMAIAWALAQTHGQESGRAIVSRIAQGLPDDCPVHGAMPSLLRAAEAQAGYGEFLRSVSDIVGSADRHHAVRSCLAVMAGLLSSNDDPTRAILVTAGMGGAADQTTPVTALFATVAWGALPSEWRRPLGDSYLSGVWQRGANPPSKLDSWSKQIQDSLPAIETLAPLPTADDLAALLDEVDDAAEVGSPEAATTDADEAQPSHDPESTESVAATDLAAEVGSPDDSAEGNESDSPANPEVVPSETAPAQTVDEGTPDLAVQPEPTESAPLLIETTPPSIDRTLRTSVEADGLVVTVRMIDNVPLLAERAADLQIEVANPTDTEVAAEIHLPQPEGWEVASRVAPARIAPHSNVRFPAVVKPVAREAADVAPLRLRVNQEDVMLPLPSVQRWSVVGPFDNSGDLGYDKTYGPELSSPTGDAVYNGRSNIAVKWETRAFDGHLFELEDVVLGGPGVIYLGAQVEFPRGGDYRLTVSSPTGAKAWVDGRRILMYHDIRDPDHRPNDFNTAPFVTNGNATVLIKIPRSGKPLGTTVVTFWSEDGRVVWPSSVRPFA